MADDDTVIIDESDEEVETPVKKAPKGKTPPAATPKGKGKTVAAPKGKGKTATTSKGKGKTVATPKGKGKAPTPTLKSKGKTASKGKAPASKKAAEQSDDDEKVRRFKIVPDSIVPEVDADLLSKDGGHYKGKSPLQAARKAFSNLCRSCSSGEETAEYRFSIIECTRGNKKTVRTYTGTHGPLDEPKTVTTKNGTTYSINSKNVVRAVKKTENQPTPKGKSKAVAPKGKAAAPKGKAAAPKGKAAAPKGKTAAPKGKTAAPKGKPVESEDDSSSSESEESAPIKKKVLPKKK